MVRTVLVTGATGGIGAAVVRALAVRGDRVLALGRSPERLAALGSLSDRVIPVPIDLSERIELPAPLAGLDRLDALVHCAGIAEVASIEETDPELWRRTFAVNVGAAVDLTRRLLPALRVGRARVVFVNLAPGTRAVPRWSAYVASKSALREFADSLRVEEAANGLRVTTVYPAGTATDLLETVRARFGRPYDPAAAIQPGTLAGFVTMVLDSPADAYLTELSVGPAPAG